MQNQLARTSPEIVSILHQRASGWYEKEGYVEEAIGHALSIKSVIDQARGDISGEIQLAEEANRILPSNRIDDLLARAVNSLTLSAWYEATGDITKSIPYLKDLMDAGRRIGYDYAVVTSQVGRAEIEMALSHLDSAAEICRAITEDGSSLRASCPLPAAASAYGVLGQISYERNDRELAKYSRLSPFAIEVFGGKHDPERLSFL